MPENHPADSQDLPVSQVQGIDKLCDEFESEWHSGKQPSIQEFLDRAGSLSRSVLLIELIAAECAVRRHLGETVDLEEYQQRFPAELEAVEAGWNLAGGKPVAVGVSTTKASSPDRDSTQTIPPRKGRAPDEPPTQIGRYQVTRLLGEGAFGAVYLANDDQLKRAVAIKVPHANLILRAEDAHAYLLEAQTLASLDHPHIVPVYDVGSTDEYPCFVVSKFIEGTDLAERAKQEPLTHDDAAQLIATVADALQHTHNRGLVHRDIKPANILIDMSGNTFVADFGLALRDEDCGKSATFVGTPAYMSPEQARGEGHRVDGRSDIFSLGVVLYELLTGSRPFRGDDIHTVLDNIINLEARPPRHLKESIPKELDRICLKALSKRATDRYVSAVDMADDLRHFDEVLTETDDAAKPIKIVPKGLRSFDASDSDFFLELLSGARDREGLPEIIRFWKTRVEETCADKTFSVGLLYGPSGCGKSSLVRAGLLPRLADHVSCVFVEATPEDTERRLLNGLRKACPDLPRDRSLVETVAAMRRGRGIPAGRKVLIVLDQFEQWVHTRRAVKVTELAETLRHCEGGRVQCLLIVRDDFWMPVSEFMGQLEVRNLEGHNSAGVPLFDFLHAKKVLCSFGQAFGRLPDNLGTISTAQQQFVDDAVNGLAENDRVISVRLAMFAEMMKGRPWTPVSLQAVGGAKGVGVTFLEETFSAKMAPPEHRHYEKVARAVLKTLLPESGTDIKGSMRSYEELLDASGYRERTTQFDNLLRILDTEIRLITPTDPAGANSDEDTVTDAESGQGHYQLTHDYLVPSLRDWLTRKQKETRRGRAELRLAERSALWNVKLERRHLPSIWEWINIRSLTDKKKWTPPQRKMMAKAGRWHGLRMTLGLLLVVALSLTGLRIRDAVVEANNEKRATGLVTALVGADINQVPQILGDLQDYRQWAEPKLRAQLLKFDEASNEWLNISLALLPTDPTQLDDLEDRLLRAKPDQLETIRSLLAANKVVMVPRLWQVAQSPTAGEEDQLLAAASALAVYDPDNATSWSQLADRVAETLVAENPLRAVTWIKLLEPARRHLLASLSDVYRNVDNKWSETQVDLATAALEIYAADDVDMLVELLLEGEPEQFTSLFDEFAAHGEKAFSKMSAELAWELKSTWQDSPLDPAWPEPAASLVDKIEDFQGMVAERFAFCQTMPLDVLEDVVEQLGTSGYRPIKLRPYACGNTIQVAVVWTRDGRQWRWEAAKTPEEMGPSDESHRDAGFVPADMAGYVLTNGENDRQPVERFAGVWVRKHDDSANSRAYVGILGTELSAAHENLEREGYRLDQSFQSYLGADGQTKYCGVKLKESGDSTRLIDQTSSQLDEEEHLNRVQWDIDLHEAPDGKTTRQRAEQEAADAEALLHEKPDDVKARFARARARFLLGKDAEALEDFDFLVEKSPTSAVLYRYRAVLHARMVQPEKAQEDLSKCKEGSEAASLNAWSKYYLDAVVAAHLGNINEGMQRVEASVSQHREDPEALILAARAYSVASLLAREKGAATSTTFADRAVTLVKQAIEHGYGDYSRLDQEPDLDPIRDRDDFAKLMKAGKLHIRYSAVWNVDEHIESVESNGLAPAEHLAKCREMQSEGYRPVSISAAWIKGHVIAASVWHRQKVSDRERDELAHRQAKAAIALLRQGRSEPVRDMVEAARAYPEALTQFVHRARGSGVTVMQLLDALEQAARACQAAKGDVRKQKAHVLYGILLSLGDFTLAEIPQPRRRQLTGQLIRWCATHPSSAVHGASSWLLRKWGFDEEVVRVDQTPLAYDPSGEREWFVEAIEVTPAGQAKETEQVFFTFIVFPPAEFIIGSPASEEDHEGLEPLRRVRLSHPLAVSDREVTWEQFNPFDGGILQAAWVKQFAKQLTANEPVFGVNWFEAVSYCRWLTTQAGMSESVQCYADKKVPQHTRGPGWVELPDSTEWPANLDGRGFRLLRDLEWEYVCRSGTRTAFSFGNDRLLLGHYAWYFDNSREWSHPVGLLRPNPGGLFDIHGNLYEWCQNWTGRPFRLYRGGGWLNNASRCRAAVCSGVQPSTRDVSLGFRVALMPSGGHTSPQSANADVRRRP